MHICTLLILPQEQRKQGVIDLRWRTTFPIVPKEHSSQTAVRGVCDKEVYK